MYIVIYFRISVIFVREKEKIGIKEVKDQKIRGNFINKTRGKNKNYN